MLISDYAGHPFTAELAESLRDKRGLDVLYSYCSTVTSPKGRLEPNRTVIPVSAGRTFEKYNLTKRLVSELRYGWNTGRVVIRGRPRTHVVCNMPLISLLIIWLAGTLRRVRLVVWFQDAQSGLVEGVLGPGLVARSLDVLEGFVLRRAHRVIAISTELGEEATRQGVPPSRVVVIENWAPIEELPAVARDNDWSRAHGLSGSPVLLYSGTLGRKHRAELLVELAQAVSAHGAQVVVVSEGEGATMLSQAKEAANISNLVVLPYQPFEHLPEVLGSADVLLALLEPTAGKFSVPSKVLSYLCARRPVLAAIPQNNTAAKILTERARAGVVVGPADSEQFCEEALALLRDEARRHDLGARGRLYAEARFRADDIMDRFLAALQH